MAEIDVPVFDADLHTDELLLDRLRVYRELRDAGPVVWLEHFHCYALPRHAEVVAALMDWKSFSSAQGVGLNDFMNNLGSSLMMDPPEHDRLRKVHDRPLLPNAVGKLEPELREVAEQRIGELIERRRFDAVADLAAVLPLSVVSRLVGLPDDGRERMLEWGVGSFDAFGLPDNPRCQAGIAAMQDFARYIGPASFRLKPGSWGELLMQAAESGELTYEHAVMLMNDYVFPSLDTTIIAISGGIKLFAEHPEQWALLRSDRSLMKSAISEIMRHTTPIQWFTRTMKHDHELAGVTLPAGARVKLMFASANRDERKFPDPDRFDITRDPTDQIGFGKGKHVCRGMPLARLEMGVVFDVLADHVERIEIRSEEPLVNNVLAGLESLEVAVS